MALLVGPADDALATVIAPFTSKSGEGVWGVSTLGLKGTLVSGVPPQNGSPYTHLSTRGAGHLRH